MIGYGMAKAAVHQLVKSLASSGSGLPTNSCVLGLLPITLDTPMNRKFMSGADTWVNNEYHFECSLYFKWPIILDQPGLHSQRLEKLCWTGLQESKDFSLAV